MLTLLTVLAITLPAATKPATDELVSPTKPSKPAAPTKPLKPGAATVSLDAKLPQPDNFPGRFRSYCDRNTGYIATVNGELPSRTLNLRNGSVVTIRGKGFHTRELQSSVGIFPTLNTMGVRLELKSWSDHEIIAKIPVNQTAITTVAPDAILYIQPISSEGYMLRCLRPKVSLNP